MTCLACLEGPGLHLDFHWSAHLFILHRSLQSCSALLIESLVTDGKDVKVQTTYRHYK